VLESASQLVPSTPTASQAFMQLGLQQLLNVHHMSLPPVVPYQHVSIPVIFSALEQS